MSAYGRTDNGAEEGLVFGWAEDVAVDDLPAVLIGAQEVLIADDRAALLHVVAREVLRTQDSVVYRSRPAVDSGSLSTIGPKRVRQFRLGKRRRVAQNRGRLGIFVRRASRAQ